MSIVSPNYRVAPTLSEVSGVLQRRGAEETWLPARDRVGCGCPGQDLPGSNPPGALRVPAFGGPEGAFFSTLFVINYGKHFGGGTKRSHLRNIRAYELEWDAFFAPNAPTPTSESAFSLAVRLAADRRFQIPWTRPPGF